MPIENNERVLSDSEKKYFKVLNGELLVNLLFIIIGILLYMISLNINICLGIVFIISGVFSFLAFRLRDDVSLYGFNVIYGIVGLVIGLVTLFGVNVNVMLGLYLFYSVVVNIDLFIRLVIVKEKSWSFVMMVCFLMGFMGFMVISNPFKNLSIEQVIGSFLILFSVLDCTKVYMLKNRSHNFV